jgi:3-deoxy-manno-octulosonate cytidylyltransferase (CMP-KDO synthetase)
VRDGQPDFNLRPPRFLQHLGIYAYRRRFLLTLADLPPHPLEQLEKLEQLRVLAHGRRLQVGVVGQSAPGVDTYEDYLRFVAGWRQNRHGHAA